MKYAHMCAHLYVHTQSSRWLTNKQINFWRYGNLPKRNAKREGRNRVARAKRDREREHSNQANNCVTSPSSSRSLSLSFSVQFQSHAAPHLVVNATIRVVNNVTVSIPQRDLLEPRDTLQNEPVPNQQQQLLHSMERWRGEGAENLSICFYNSISIDVKRNDRFIKTVKIELEIESRDREIRHSIRTQICPNQTQLTLCWVTCQQFYVNSL